MHGRKAQHAEPPARADTIEALALEEPMRGHVDDVGACGGNAPRRHHVERHSLEDEQVSPPLRHDVGGAPARGELDEHVAPIDADAELRPLAARRRTRRVTGDRGVSQRRVVTAACDVRGERLPT